MPAIFSFIGIRGRGEVHTAAWLSCLELLSNRTSSSWDAISFRAEAMAACEEARSSAVRTGPLRVGAGAGTASATAATCNGGSGCGGGGTSASPASLSTAGSSAPAFFAAFRLLTSPAMRVIDSCTAATWASKVLRSSSCSACSASRGLPAKSRVQSRKAPSAASAVFLSSLMRWCKPRTAAFDNGPRASEKTMSISRVPLRMARIAERMRPTRGPPSSSMDT
mmetsp:Transcript_75438/g.208166  ORF Transcript_75438/g.208166 Transcript_75438/m.208166 type:complete len:223 (+) Transcript_75438:304-972(+)